MCRFYLVFYISLFTAFCLNAQPEEARNISFSAFAVSYAQEHRTIYLLDSQGEVSEVPLSTANVKGPYPTVLSPNSTVILRTKTTSPEEGVIYPPIAEIKIPAGMKEPLAILVPSSNEHVYRAIVVERSLSSFPNGSYTLINFSAFDIRGLVGKTKVVAPSREVTSFKPSTNEGGMLDVHFQYEREDVGDWKTFGRTRWVEQDNQRTLLLAYPDPRTKRLILKGIPIRATATNTNSE